MDLSELAEEDDPWEQIVRYAGQLNLIAVIAFAITEFVQCDMVEIETARSLLFHLFSPYPRRLCSYGDLVRSTERL